MMLLHLTFLSISLLPHFGQSFQLSPSAFLTSLPTSSTAYSLSSSPSLPTTPCSINSESSTRLHMAKSGTKKKKTKDGTISVNRLAYRNYEIIETLEAGISLLGTEIKSIRDGKLNLRDGYVRTTPNNRGCTLHNVHIGKHSYSSEFFNHEETRVRTLLVHKQQAKRWSQQIERQGMTLIPLKAYFNDRNKVKLQIALCRGKNVRDKRASIKEREAKKDANRMVKNFRV